MLNNQLLNSLCEVSKDKGKISWKDYKEHLCAFGAGIAFGWLAKITFDSGMLDPYLKQYGLLRVEEGDKKTN